MNAAHRFPPSSQYLPSGVRDAGLVVTLPAPLRARFAVGTCERAKTDPNLFASRALDFATIFSSFRIDGVFFAI
jgi:hypothetical protein